MVTGPKMMLNGPRMMLSRFHIGFKRNFFELAQRGGQSYAIGSRLGRSNTCRGTSQCERMNYPQRTQTWEDLIQLDQNEKTQCMNCFSWFHCLSTGVGRKAALPEHPIHAV